MDVNKSTIANANQGGIHLGYFPSLAKRNFLKRLGAILTTIVIAVLIIIIGYIKINDHKSTEQRLMTQAVPLLDASDSAALHTVVQKIQAISGNNKNINYAYVNLVYYIKTSDVPIAQKYYTIYANLTKTQKPDSILASHVDSLPTLSSRLVAVESATTHLGAQTLKPLVIAP